MSKQSLWLLGVILEIVLSRSVRVCCGQARPWSGPGPWPRQRLSFPLTNKRPPLPRHLSCVLTPKRWSKWASRSILHTSSHEVLLIVCVCLYDKRQARRGSWPSPGIHRKSWSSCICLLGGRDMEWLSSGISFHIMVPRSIVFLFIF